MVFIPRGEESGIYMCLCCKECDMC